jgi:hypothetical protein
VTEERQRILREAGHRPAQAEKEASAEAAKAQAGRPDDSEEVGREPANPDQPRPLAEDDPDRPRPRS